jgi:hypothetical protein
VWALSSKPGTKKKKKKKEKKILNRSVLVQAGLKA